MQRASALLSLSLSFFVRRVSSPAFFFFYLRPLFLFVSSPLIFPTIRCFSFFLSFSRERKKKPGAGFLFIRRRKLEEGEGESSAGMIRVNKDKSNSGGTGEEREIKCSLTSDSRKRRFLFFKAKHAPRRIPAETNRGKPRLYPRILNFIKEPLSFQFQFFFDSSGLVSVALFSLSLSLLVLFLYSPKSFESIYDLKR